MRPQPRRRPKSQHYFTIALWWVRSIGLAAAVGSAYFLSARLSLGLLTNPDGVAVFWPAAGVSAGVLIAIGPGARWPVAAGAVVATMAANLMGDRNVPSAIVFALSNAGEAVLVAWLIEHYFGGRFELDRLRHVLGLIVAALTGTAVSGIGGTLGYVLFHTSAAPPLTIWEHWVTSDAFGVIAVAPLLIGIASAVRDPPSPREVVDGILALALLTALSVVVAFIPREPWTTAVPTALLFPILLWLAARCRPVFAAAAAFIVAFSIVWTTTFGFGHFGDARVPLADRVLAAQASILAVSLCALAVAALFAERRRNEAALKESEARLQEALAAGAVTAFEWDYRTGSSRRSDNAAQIFGFDPKQPLSSKQMLARVHPDDRARLKAFVYGVSPESAAYSVTFRFTRLDGREVWLEETSRAEFDAAGSPVCLKGLTLDITERKRAEAHQGLLISELDHRVKNILARVAHVAEYSRQGSGSMDQFVQALDGRIQSMADAHSLLSRNRWLGVSLVDLVRRQLAPYSTERNLAIGGPDIMLSAEATQALAMVLQELVTNAVKYGALSQPHGRVSVTWVHRSSLDVTGRLAFAWRETGGPPPDAPAKSSYGTDLIRGLIPRELGGAVELAFPREGARCDIEIPVRSALTVAEGRPIAVVSPDKAQKSDRAQK
jgi:PAS domain S-box-containing protein